MNKSHRKSKDILTFFYKRSRNSLTNNTHLPDICVACCLGRNKYNLKKTALIAEEWLFFFIFKIDSYH